MSKAQEQIEKSNYGMFISILVMIALLIAFWVVKTYFSDMMVEIGDTVNKQQSPNNINSMPPDGVENTDFVF